MKASVLVNEEVLTHKDGPTPEPGPGHVRLKIKAISIWGSEDIEYVR